MYSVTIQRHFDAAHHLDHYEGKCANIHGHRWTVEMTLEDETLDFIGMVVDFSEVKKRLDVVLDGFDHTYLNEVPMISEMNPTAENLARYIFYRLKPFYNTQLTKIRIYESPESWAEYYEE